MLSVIRSLVVSVFGDSGELRRIRGFQRYYVSASGFVYSAKHGPKGWSVIRLKTMRHSHGYLQVNLSLEGKSHIMKVHRLVAAAFLGPGKPGQVVRHRNDTRDDNRARNLRWGTQKDNAKDARRNGIRLGRPCSLPDTLIAEVRRRLNDGERGGRIALDLGISPTYVSNLKHGNRRKEIECLA